MQMSGSAAGQLVGWPAPSREEDSRRRPTPLPPALLLRSLLVTPQMESGRHVALKIFAEGSDAAYHRAVVCASHDITSVWQTEWASLSADAQRAKCAAACASMSRGTTALTR